MQLFEALLAAGVLFLFLWFFFSLGFHSYGRSTPGAGGCSAAMAGVTLFCLVGSALLGGYFWGAIIVMVLGAVIYFNTKSSLEQERREREKKR